MKIKLRQQIMGSQCRESLIRSCDRLSIILAFRDIKIKFGLNDQISIIYVLSTRNTPFVSNISWNNNMDTIFQKDLHHRTMITLITIHIPPSFLLSKLTTTSRRFFRRQHGWDQRDVEIHFPILCFLFMDFSFFQRISFYRFYAIRGKCEHENDCDYWRKRGTVFRI